MKKTFKYLLALAALSFAAAACVKETVHEAGEPEVDGCYGVYFPAQDSDLILDPADPMKASIAVARTLSDGAIEVPVVVADTSGIFSVSSLSFEDGQSESSISLEFAQSVVGKTYYVSFKIEDPQYASKYNSNPIALDFRVTREKWNELGPIGFDENYFWGISVAQDSEYAAILYSNDNDPNLYRVENPFAKRYSNFTDGSEWLTFRVLKKGDVVLAGTDYESKITEDGLVYYDDFNTGYTHSSYNKKIWLLHPASFKAYKDAPESWGEYNRVLQYQESGLPAAVSIAPFYYMLGTGGWSGGVGMQSVVITFPGAVLTDYSIEAEAGETVDGEVPVAFEFGADVAAVKYCVYEGSLSTAAVNKYAAAIGDGSETAAEELDIEQGAVSLKCEKSGIYTLVAVSFDEAKEAQEKCSVEFSYVASGDEDDYAVSITAGVELTSRYEAQGYNKTNSIAYYIYGQDLADVKCGLFTKAQLDARTLDSLVMDVVAGASLGEEIIGEINDGGYDSLITGLAPLTDYVFVVWGSNGYLSKVVTASISTEGLPRVKLGTGDYTYDGYWEGTDSDQELYSDPNYKNTMVIANWGAGVDFTFTYDPETQKLNVPLQPIGASNGSYGPVYVIEAKAYFDAEDEEYEDLIDSYFDTETATFNFCVAYIVRAGYIAYGVETFVMNDIITLDASNAKASYRGADVRFAGKKTLDFAPSYVMKSPVSVGVLSGLKYERSVKAAAFSARSIDKASVKLSEKKLSEKSAVENGIFRTAE